MSTWPRLLDIRALAPVAPSYLLQLIDDNDATGLAVTAVNGAARYARLDLFVHHRRVSDALQESLALGSGPLLYDLLGLHQIVPPRDAFVSELGFVASGVGTYKFPLFARWGAQLRCEVVGPSLWMPANQVSLDDALGRQLPTRYHEGGVPVWWRLWAATLLIQFILPLASLSDPLKRMKALLSEDDIGAAALKDYVGLLVQFSASNDTGRGAGVLLFNLVKTFVYDLVHAGSLTNAPRASASRALRSRLVQLWGEAVVKEWLERLALVLTGWELVGTGLDLAFAGASLSNVRAQHRFLITSPLARTLIRVDPAPLTAFAQKPLELDFFLQWIEFPDLMTDSREFRNRDFSSTASTLLGNAVAGVDGSITLSDLIMRTGNEFEPVPLTLRFAPINPEPALQPLLKPSAWDPRKGDGPVPVALGPGPIRLFVGGQAGAGTLALTVTNEDEWFPADDEFRRSTEEVTLTVEPSVLRVQTPAVHVTAVGERGHARFTLATPDGAEFASDAAFTGIVTLSEDRKRLTIDDISVEAPDPWSEGTVTRRLPFSFELEEYEEGRLRFVAPEADAWLDAEHGVYADGLGAYLEGWAPGPTRVLVIPRDRGLAPSVELHPEDPTFGVIVQPSYLNLELRSLDDQDGDGAVVLEDRWLEDSGELVGGVHVTVRSRSQVLFDSNERAYFQGSWDGQHLDIDVILVEDEQQNLQMLPFRMEVDVADAAVSRLRLVDDGEATPVGELRRWMTLGDLLAAVGPGRTLLTVHLHPQPDGAQYRMPAPAQLPVRVPPPLEARLETWSDEFVSAPLTGSLTSPTEIIRKEGTLHGKVQQHRAASRTERITLSIAAASGASRSIDLRSPTDPVATTLAGDGAFTHHESELTAGTNVFILSAWKPIHRVLGRGPSRVDGAVHGVPPREVALLSPSEGTLTLSRNLPNALCPQPIRSRYARATRATISSEHAGATVRRDLPATYDAHTTDDSPRLGEGFGDHYLRLEAHNDFGSASAGPRKLVAGTPSVDWSIDPLRANGGDGPTAPGNLQAFGNSSVRMLVNGTTDHALTLTIAGQAEFIVPASEPSDFGPVTLPRTGELQIGENRFDVEVANEFGTVRREIVVHRRPLVYELRNFYWGVERKDGNDYTHILRVSYVFRDGRPAEPVLNAGSSMSIASASSASAADLVPWTAMSWECLEKTTYTDNNGTHEVLEAASFEVRVRGEGSITDPDYAHLLVALEVRPPEIAPGGDESRVYTPFDNFALHFTSVVLKATTSYSTSDPLPLVVITPNGIVR